MARESALDHKGKQIATIVTKSEVITSSFGDQRLFFKHEDKKLDQDLTQLCPFPSFDKVPNGFNNDARVNEWANFDAEATLRASI